MKEGTSGAETNGKMKGEFEDGGIGTMLYDDGGRCFKSWKRFDCVVTNHGTPRSSRFMLDLWGVLPSDAILWSKAFRK